MKKFVIILVFLPFVSQAQLSTNQKKQVTTMIATATTVTNKRFDSLVLQNTLLNKKIDSFMVVLDTADFIINKKVVSLKKKL